MQITHSFTDVRPGVCVSPAISQRGWTLLELLWVLMVMGTLAALATVSYQHYMNKARAADLLLRYDAIRASILIASVNNETRCDVLQQGFDRSNLSSSYANLRYGWQSVQGGYRPVLNVCATVDRPNVRGVLVAQEAYREFDRLGVVLGAPVVTPTVVSYALALGERGGPLCTQAQPVTVARACDEPIPTATLPTTTTTTTKGVLPVIQAANPTTVTDPPVQAVAVTPDVSSIASTPQSLPPQIAPAVTQASVAPPQAPQSPGLSLQGGSGVSLNACLQSCRSICPHCNSIAYRTCMANCRR